MVQLLFAAVWLLFLAADQVGALGPPKGHHKGLKDMPKHPDAFGVAEYWQWVAAVGAAHDRKLRQKQERVVIPFVHHTRLLEPQYPNFPTALAALAATNGTSKVNPLSSRLQASQFCQLFRTQVVEIKCEFAFSRVHKLVHIVCEQCQVLDFRLRLVSAEVRRCLEMS